MFKCKKKKIKSIRYHDTVAFIKKNVLRRAISSVHDRLAECRQRNEGHLEDVIFRVELYVVFFLCSVLCLKTTDSLFLQMLKYVLPYKCKCIMISNTFNFFNT